uniref:Ferritin-like protein n=1 Tax=Fasciola hepatica TaxID=6192 RepID=Q2L7A9_FASHE|nr:ferritin-like protein [Fasciola hepatica]
MRGGKFVVPEIKPLFQVNEIGQLSIEKMLQTATELEKKLEQMVRQLHQTARSKDDIATCELIEQKCLQHQYYVIRMMVNHVNGVKVSKDAYLYDCMTMTPLVKKINKLLNWRTKQPRVAGVTARNFYRAAVIRIGIKKSRIRSITAQAFVRFWLPYGIERKLSLWLTTILSNKVDI